MYLLRLQTFNGYLSSVPLFTHFVKRMAMTLSGLYDKTLKREFLDKEEGIFLFEHAPLTELMHVANELRKMQVPHGKVTWQIDRNVNTTNVCIANCKFCNFFRRPGHEDSSAAAAARVRREYTPARPRS